jgi:hypothetical protein
MRELDKIKRVLAKKIEGAPHEVLLVLDATTGQNAVNQAMQFKEVVDVTGLFLAKLDGTAKGGAGDRDPAQVDIPVKFIASARSRTTSRRSTPTRSSKPCSSDGRDRRAWAAGRGSICSSSRRSRSRCRSGSSPTPSTCSRPSAGS